MTASARVLVPITITDAMILGGTSVAEPASSETAWVSAGTYTAGQERIRATTHMVYECSVGHTGRTALPEVDTGYWFEKRPTSRWAPYDDYANTKCSTVTTLTYVLQPGFANGMALYGLEGEAYSMTVKDAPGGTVTKTASGDLYEQAAGFYELLFAPVQQRTQLSFDDLPISPTAEITVTITATAGQPVAIGTLKVGDWRQFIGDGAFGGTRYGAESDRTSYSYRQYAIDGTYKTIKRPNSRDVRAQVVIDAEQAMYADAILAEIIDTAVPFEAAGLDRYAYLNTMGFVNGKLRADSYGTTILDLTIKGTI